RAGAVDWQMFVGSGHYWRHPLAGTSARRQLNRRVLFDADGRDRARQPLEFATADCVVCQLYAAARIAFAFLQGLGGSVAIPHVRTTWRWAQPTLRSVAA